MLDPSAWKPIATLLGIIEKWSTERVRYIVAPAVAALMGVAFCRAAKCHIPMKNNCIDNRRMIF